MSERAWLVVRRGWWLEVAIAVGAAVLMTALAASSAVPALSRLLPFVVLLVLAENGAVMLPSSTGISPSFMIVMAAIAAFSHSSVVVGAGLVGAAGGFHIGLLRDRKYTTVLFNCAQYAVSSTAAAAVYAVVEGNQRGGQALLAAVLAAVSFAVVNIGCVIPQIALNFQESPRAVWADMRPQLPNYLAFGMLGVLVGQLFTSVGPLALALVFIPAVIARATFSSYLELREAHEAAVRVFVKAIDAKDRYTAGHCERVATYAGYIGEELGFSPARLEHLRYAALMHDVGKLAVPSALLNKPGKLTPEEYAQIQRHNDVCIEILTRVDFLRDTVPSASDRHAHFGADQESEDPAALEAYAVAVADAFDAMTSTRAYRRALSQDVAFAELRDKSGTQFHPASAAALIRAIEKRGERYGLGYEHDAHQFEVAPPVVGLGSAGLGDLLTGTAPA